MKVKVYLIWEKTLNEAETEYIYNLYGIYSSRKKAKKEKIEAIKWAEESDQDYEYEIAMKHVE